MTVRRLELPASSSRDDWASLRQPDTLGVALFDCAQPHIVALDPMLSGELERHGALEGSNVAELELAHPFAESSAAWRRHVRLVRKCEFVLWPTWLLAADGVARRARLRLRVSELGGAEYLVAEVIELGTPRSVSFSADMHTLGLDDIPCGACRVAGSGSVIASNARAMAFLEYQFDAQQNEYVLELPRRVVSAERKPLEPSELPWFQSMRQGKPETAATLGVRRTDGSHTWLLVSVSPSTCERPGTLAAPASSALVTLFDITSIKEASDALREADHKLRRTISSVTNLQDQLARSEHMASLGLMAAGVAHEINNPLSYILSNLSFAAERAIDQESRVALREALEGAGRVRDIVRDLKTLSRMESEEDLKPVDPRNAVDAALKLAFDDIRHRARVQRHFTEVPRVLGDETRLVQVMLNLVTNAAQSIPLGAPDQNQITVEVTLASGGSEVEIAVTDTGIGISSDHLPKVFEPFFTTKPAGEGTGLGLSICHRLIHAMGGRIQVSSEEGRGSRFSVFLAVAAVQRDLDAPTSDLPSATLRRLRLLIIDDEVLVARAVRRMFDKEFRVEIALDGKAALEKLEQGDYDVILCDVMMPGIGGIDVFRQVRAKNEALAGRFVFATGGLFSQELSDAVRRLSNMIVEKPFDPDELRRVIEVAAVAARSETSPPTIRRGLDPLGRG